MSPIIGMVASDRKANVPGLPSQDSPVRKTTKPKRPSAKKVKTEPPSKALEVLARNLVALRDSHAELTSQATIGEKAKVDQRTVGRIINKEHEPTIAVVDRLARAFGLSAWQLLADPFSPTNAPTLAVAGPREQAFYAKLTSTREAIDGILRDAGNTDPGDLGSS